LPKGLLSKQACRQQSDQIIFLIAQNVAQEPVFLLKVAHNFFYGQKCVKHKNLCYFVVINTAQKQTNAQMAKIRPIRSPCWHVYIFYPG
jgi:hypothetical protein